MYSLIPKVNSVGSSSSHASSREASSLKELSTSSSEFSPTLTNSTRNNEKTGDVNGDTLNTIMSLINDKKPPSTGILDKIRGALSKDSRDTDTKKLTDPDEFIYTPPSYIQPLRQKMTARSENETHPTAREHALYRPDSTTTATWYQLTSRSFSHLSGDATERAPCAERGGLPSATAESSFDSDFQFDATNLSYEDLQHCLQTQGQYLAHSFGVDAESKLDWADWITHYAQGHFNVNNPPYAPRTTRSIYLPCVYPSTEEARLEASQTFDAIWRSGDSAQHELLLGNEKLRCYGENVSLSFFDTDHEIIKVSNCDQAGNAKPRVHSLATHALLSTEIFVVLDTHLDWRFVNHPQVLRAPHVRSFIGVPVLSEDGWPVAVVSIWSDEPKMSLSPRARQDLALTGTHVARNLERELTEFLNPIPLVDRDYLDNPPFLRMYQDPNTPPPSANSNQVSKFPSGTSLKNLKELSVDSDPTLSFDQRDEEPFTPDSVFFHERKSSRPYSGSDITSINLHPPNTPHTSLHGHATAQYKPNLFLVTDRFGGPVPSVADFNALSDDDVAEQVSQESPTPLTTKTARNTRLYSHILSLIPDDKNPFTMRLWAQKLNYDCFYLVMLEATDVEMKYEELLRAPDSIQMRVIAAYGLTTPVADMDRVQHLEALRARCIEEFKDSATSSSGLLGAIHTQTGPLPDRKSVCVIAGARDGRITESDREAFRMARHIIRQSLELGRGIPCPADTPAQASPEPAIEEDAEKDAGKEQNVKISAAYKARVRAKRAVKPKLPCAPRENTQPDRAAELESYPAGEAQEVGRSMARLSPTLLDCSQSELDGEVRIFLDEAAQKLAEPEEERGRSMARVRQGSRDAVNHREPLRCLNAEPSYGSRPPVSFNNGLSNQSSSASRSPFLHMSPLPRLPTGSTGNLNSRRELRRVGSQDDYGTEGSHSYGV